MNNFIVPAILFYLLAPVQQSIAQKSVQNGLPQGAVATSVSGFALSAKINGKAVKAHAMMPPDKAEQIVGFYDGDKYIGLPYNSKNMVAGRKLDFSTENADLTTRDNIQVWNGRKGEMEITKVSGGWVEGKFFFTGYSYDNKNSIQVTEGLFRIPVKATN